MTCKRARPGAGSVPYRKMCVCFKPSLYLLQPSSVGPCLEPTSHHAGCLLTKRPPLPRSVSALMCPANGPLESRVCTYRNRPRLGPASNTNPRPITRGCLLTGPLYSINRYSNTVSTSVPVQTAFLGSSQSMLVFYARK